MFNKNHMYIQFKNKADDEFETSFQQFLASHLHTSQSSLQ